MSRTAVAWDALPMAGEKVVKNILRGDTYIEPGLKELLDSCHILEPLLTAILDGENYFVMTLNDEASSRVRMEALRPRKKRTFLD